MIIDTAQFALARPRRLGCLSHPRVWSVFIGNSAKSRSNAVGCDCMFCGWTGSPRRVCTGSSIAGPSISTNRAFDATYDKHSVGLVTMGLAIKCAIEEGAEEFDLLHGNEAYKSHWSSDSRELGRLEVYPPGSLGWICRSSVELERASRRIARRGCREACSHDSKLDQERGAARVMSRTGLDKVGRLAVGRNGVPLVIGYHRIVEDFASSAKTSIPSMLVSRGMLEQHLDWLGSRFRFISLDELGARLEGKDDGGDPVAAITFDDGYRDFYDHALPVLQRKGVPAAVFVVTDLVGTQRVQVHDKLYLLLARRFKPGKGTPAAVRGHPRAARNPASGRIGKGHPRAGIGDSDRRRHFQAPFTR